MIVDNCETFRKNIKNKLFEIIKDKDNSKKIERSIFNFAIQEAKKKGVIKKWDNKNFCNIYVDRFRSIYFNINKKSYVDNKTFLKNLKKKN